MAEPISQQNPHRDQGPDTVTKSIDRDTGIGAESTLFWQDAAQVLAEEGVAEAGATSGNGNVVGSYRRLSQEGLHWKALSARLQQKLLSQ